MAGPALIFEDGLAADVPGVHAIVIGIGHYRHFPGGEGVEKDAGGEIMPQLSSPPHSARAVADFLFDTYHKDPERPLRSLAMIIAERGGPAEYGHVLRSHPGPIPDATFANLSDAIVQWFLRGDAHPDNLMIFYICCHGISSGMEQSLLASDFLAHPLDSFNHAIDFGKFHSGMARCAAEQQVYFVDACRTISENLIKHGSKGQAVVDTQQGIFKETAPIFKSALEGQTAWGQPNKPSPFAQALPLAFKGGAWVRQNGTWSIDTSKLQYAMEQQIKRVMRAFRSFNGLVEVDRGVSLRLKSLGPAARPIYPVEILCRPEDANKSVVLSAQPSAGGNVIPIPLRDPPQKDSWLFDLEMGDYDMHAKFPGAEFNDPPAKPISVNSDNVSEIIEVI